MRVNRVFFFGIPAVLLLFKAFAIAGEQASPEAVLRALVQANAEKDLTTMGELMAHDPDIVGYTIGGRKYVGWSDFARDVELEFASVQRLEIPISNLTVWSRGDTAWFAMELDYIRHVSGGTAQETISLRETGVLERRAGRWMLVAWHESPRHDNGVGAFESRQLHSNVRKVSASQLSGRPDLSGEWDIQEEDKSYKATLDREGNGAYTWQNGKIVTTGFEEQKWQGTWQQTGNDREGAFEVLLSEDGTQAKGVWWYTRVGDKEHIPARQWGGSYTWKRLTPPPNPAPAP